MNTEPWAIVLVLLAGIIGAFGPIFLKKGSGLLKFDLKSILTNYQLVLGLGFYAAGTLLFIPALKGGDLSVLYPFVSLSYIWVSLLSMKFLGEKMSALRWIGLALIVGGVSLIGLGSG